jgi:hypothetical protein
MLRARRPMGSRGQKEIVDGIGYNKVTKYAGTSSEDDADASTLLFPACTAFKSKKERMDGFPSRKNRGHQVSLPIIPAS